MRKIVALIMCVLTLFTGAVLFTACGESEPCKVELILEINPKETGYRVMGIKECECTIIEIPEMYNDLPVVEIATAAFKNNSTIKEVIIPSKLTKILQSAFENCTALEKVTFKQDSTLKQIAKTAFKNCVSLKEISLPQTVTTIQYGAFLNCTSLTEIVLPTSLKTISQFLFGSNTALKKVTLPKALKSIEYYAFDNCVNLDTIIYPSSSVNWAKVVLDELWNSNVPATEILCQEIVEIA